jgi:hypothetical protein
MKYGYGVTETAIRNLIEAVLQDRTAQSAALIAALRSGPVSVEDRERMRECLADELLETGLEDDAEPNERVAAKSCPMLSCEERSPIGYTRSGFFLLVADRSRSQLALRFRTRCRRGAAPVSSMASTSLRTAR